MANFTADGVCGPSLGPAEPTLLSNVLFPTEDGGYARSDVLLAGGKIAFIGAAGAALPADLSSPSPLNIDCTERMLLPGFVNAHTHSVEHWCHGLIKPLPLELWVQQLLRHEPRGAAGWYGADSFSKTPADMIKISAVLCGVESMLSGCSAVLDHLFVRDLDDIAAAVEGYKASAGPRARPGSSPTPKPISWAGKPPPAPRALRSRPVSHTPSRQAVGVRAFIAPMLGDEAAMYDNYIPKVPDATARNQQCGGGCCGAMGVGGAFREPGESSYSPDRMKAALQLWEEAVQRFHDPAGGVEIVIGPVTAYSASAEMLRGAAELRKKYDLCGHTHLLETRAQVRRLPRPRCAVAPAGAENKMCCRLRPVGPLASRRPVPAAG